MKPLICFYFLFYLSKDEKITYSNYNHQLQHFEDNPKMTPPMGGRSSRNGDKIWQMGKRITQYSDVTNSVLCTNHLFYVLIWVNHNCPCLLYHFIHELMMIVGIQQLVSSWSFQHLTELTHFSSVLPFI